MANFRRLRLALAFLLAALPLPARASVAVLVGEPFGHFGTIMPTGHTTIYLDRICADGPLKLRMCHPGEPSGVAIQRLNDVSFDWIATPIMDYLYAVDSSADVLPYATPTAVADLREIYRRRFLLPLIPDGAETHGDWWESLGMAYHHRQWGYQLATTPGQDARLVALLNDDANRHHYHLHKFNCADFAAQVVNFYYPGLVKVNTFPDLNLMTPKNVARCVSRYGHAHPEAALHIYVIPQVPGSLPRSHTVRGASDMLLKTKGYVATLSVIQPEAVIALLALYIEGGRWDIGRNSVIADPATFDQRLPDTTFASK